MHAAKLNNTPEKLNNFDKFGINLFLAGASESLADVHNLDKQSQKNVLADSIQLLGQKKSHITVFLEKYEGYLLQDPCYLQMHQSGRNAMALHLQDPRRSLESLSKAIENWNLPKSKLKETKSITLLSSNIFMPTSTTQVLTNADTKKLLQAHDRIVRAALTRKRGHEIKHTGDGIMASFLQVFNSIEAAIQIQQEALIHNQQNPTLPLQLKIGIDTGDPATKEDGVFAHVSQNSSQIVNKARAGEIYVSENIRGICKGRGQNFSSRGNHEIKGYYGSMHLYEVLWEPETAIHAN